MYFKNKRRCCLPSERKKHPRGQTKKYEFMKNWLNPAGFTSLRNLLWAWISVSALLLLSPPGRGLCTMTNLKLACQTLWLLCPQSQRPKVTLKYIQRNKKPLGIYTSYRQHKTLLKTACAMELWIYKQNPFALCVDKLWKEWVLQSSRMTRMNTEHNEATRKFQDHTNCLKFTWNSCCQAPQLEIKNW